MNRHNGPVEAVELPGEEFTRRVITLVLALITALTFAFGFGNVWALGRSLGVPAFVAPLVGPAVDLSVAGLLIGIRHLSMAGVARDQLRQARILLTACSAATLALNIAGPGTAGAYGRAAFDSVGPGLLIGWAETGPGMLRFLYARPRDLALHGSEARPAPAYEALPEASALHLNSPDNEVGADGPSRPGTSQADRAGAAGLDELLAEARRIDQRTASGITGPSPPRRCASRCGSARCAHAHSYSGSAIHTIPPRPTSKPPAARNRWAAVIGTRATLAKAVSGRRRTWPGNLRRWPHDCRRG
jgi:hypothetical protein